MMSLQSKLKHIGTGLASVCENCYHYSRGNETPDQYLVWMEVGETGSFHADNGKCEQIIEGLADYYTKTEYDTTIDDIQSEFETLGLSWLIESVQYEPDTNYIHYEWRFYNGAVSV